MAREQKNSNSILPWTIVILGLWVGHTTYRKHQRKQQAAQQEQNRLENKNSGLRVKINHPETLSANKKASSHGVLSSTFENVKDLKKPTKFKMVFGSVLPESPPKHELIFTYNPKAQPTSFKRLLFFLSQQNGHEGDYVLDRHDCKHFAHELYEEALRQDIKSYFVTIEYVNHPVGHAVAAFPTTDQGMVYVDFTPTNGQDGFSPSKRLIWLEAGKNYLDIPVNQMWMGFENNFANFNDYHQKHRDLASDAEHLQSRIVEYKRLASTHQLEIRDFNTRVNQLNQNQVQLSPAEVSEIQDEQSRLNRQAKDLNELSQELQYEQEEIQEDQEHIGLPTSKRVVKRFELFPNY